MRSNAESATPLVSVHSGSSSQDECGSDDWLGNFVDDDDVTSAEKRELDAAAISDVLAWRAEIKIAMQAQIAQEDGIDVDELLEDIVDDISLASEDIQIALEVAALLAWLPGEVAKVNTQCVGNVGMSHAALHTIQDEFKQTHETVPEMELADESEDADDSNFYAAFTADIPVSTPEPAVRAASYVGPVMEQREGAMLWNTEVSLIGVISGFRV